MKVWIYRNFVTSHLLDINIRIEKEFSTSLASRIVDPHPPKMSNRTEGETYRDQIHAPHSHDPNRSSPLLLLHRFCEVHEACWRMFRCDYLLQLFNKKLSRTEDLNLFSFLNYLHIFKYLRFKECSLVSHEMFLLIFFSFDTSALTSFFECICDIQVMRLNSLRYLSKKEFARLLSISLLIWQVTII